MLELAKIVRDIDALGRERAELFSGLDTEIEQASAVMSEIGKNLAAAKKRIERAQTSWLVATCDEPPDKTFDVPDLPPQHAVVAVDGSQIMPNKHEVTLCYLLSTSGLILYYGTGERPVVRTSPKLSYKDDEMHEESYGGKRVRVNEKILSTRRTLAEAEEMGEMIRAAKASGVPTVALWDGTLILWPLQNEPPDYRERALSQYLQIFDEARALGIPIAGYISDPGSRDFVNSMRVMLCDQDPVNCDHCKYKGTKDVPPCDAIGRVKDSIVYSKRLDGGKRSVLFSSGSTILEHYGEHRIRAFYMDVDREIARVEVPQWVAEDDRLLSLTHAVCCDQARKGRGYPVALAEAHEYAVIRGPERQAFYDMIERSFAKHGVRLTRSWKRIAKGY